VVGRFIRNASAGVTVFIPRTESGGVVNDDVDLAALPHKRIHRLGNRQPSSPMATVRLTITVVWSSSRFFYGA
jgi:hypothetical protein